MPTLNARRPQAHYQLPHLSWNNRVETKSILKTEPPKIKKKLSFAKSIEAISFFVNTEPAQKISKEKLYLQDINNNEIRSVSSMLRIPEHWSIRNNIKSSLYPNFNVILDNIGLHDSILKIAVLVRNLDYHKLIKVRYTTDGWQTSSDVNCQFQQVVNQNHGSTVGIDRFKVDINLSKFQGQYLNVEFAISYTVKGSTFWDNNGGQNYKVNDLIDFARKTHGIYCR